MKNRPAHIYLFMTSASPRSLCERYNDECYASLRDDAVRTNAYLSAIAARAKGCVCLDIGTGSLALLAIAAAEAGARHVYALEANKAAAEDARQSVAAKGFEDIITVLEGFSTDIILPAGAPRIELLLHEIIGEIASAEGVVAALADVRARLCDGEAPCSIPARARTLLSPAEWPTADYFAAQPVPLLATPGTRVILMPALPAGLRLAPPQVCEDLSFEPDVGAANTVASSPPAQHCAGEQQAVQSRTLEFTVARDGSLRGIVCWIEIFVADGRAASPEITSTDPGSSWSNVFLLLPNPTAVQAGTRLVVRCDAELAGAQPTYCFEVLRQRPVAECASAEETALELLGALKYPENEDGEQGVEYSEDDCMVEFW